MFLKKSLYICNSTQTKALLVLISLQSCISLVLHNKVLNLVQHLFSMQQRVVNCVPAPFIFSLECCGQKSHITYHQQKTTVTRWTHVEATAEILSRAPANFDIEVFSFVCLGGFSLAFSSWSSSRKLHIRHDSSCCIFNIYMFYTFNTHSYYKIILTKRNAKLNSWKSRQYIETVQKTRAV